MYRKIQEILDLLEKREGFRILFAVESGSRAWGFSSPDSDYDVRYVYVRPAAEYLRVDPLRDTVEGPLDDVMDFAGWDLRKFLELLHRSNPSLMEWVHSPIVYRRSPRWDAVAAAVPGYFDPRSNLHHYLSMCRQDLTRHLPGEQVKVKKYLYVLRSILCGRWLEREGTLPPEAFRELMKVLPEQWQSTAEHLLELKTTSDEVLWTDRIPELNAWLESEHARLMAVAAAMAGKDPGGYEELNALFRETLARTWEETL